MDFDTELRGRIYELTLRRGVPPTITELATAVAATAADVRAGLARLAAGRIVVLQPESGEILMAPPFSAVPTPFLVETPAYSCYANCAWDALGVPVMRQQPARLVTACGCCGHAIALDLTPDRSPADGSVMHFGVPAAHWWEDMVFT